LSKITVCLNELQRERVVRLSKRLLARDGNRALKKKGTSTGRVGSIANMKFDQVGAAGQSLTEEIQN
jgi:hypothetical protein